MFVNTTRNSGKTLLFAIGNSGRNDDGLGWEFAHQIEQRRLFDGEIHYRYQLQVEDAELVSKAGLVIFVDAYHGELSEGYRWEKIIPAILFEFSTHALSPASVLYLSRELYGSEPEAWILMIEGREWELVQGLSPSALQHLENAITFFKNKKTENR